MSLIVDEHRGLLSDPTRIGAFREAIRQVVGPGMIVADLGSGTGILGMLACEAGAARVYSIEAGGMIELAKAVSKANGFEGRQTFVPGLSTLVDLPERVDVVVADQIGHFGFEAGLIDYFVDARRRFLKPGGVMIPLRVDLQIAPVEAPGCAERLQFWRRRPAGLDFEPACRWAENTGYPISFAAEELLGSEACGCAIDLMTITTNPLSVAADLTIGRSGTLHGIGGWFRARLSEGHTMTNSPLAAERIGRRHVFFPIARSVDVSIGDRVSVTMDVRPADALVTWRVAVYGAGSDAKKAEFHHSTLRGMLIRREDLRRMHPAFVPVLTERGRARLTILELCDGRRPLAEIEQEVYARHPTLFTSSGEAAAFVAEVVTGYAQ